MNDCPILFIVFNRPKVTELVFQEIRKARPKQLFVAADGPRASIAEDSVKCDQVRSIVSQIDWECEAKFLFAEVNQGCGRGVSSAITWFFDHVPAGIILEDDCVPDQSFFPFCKELLERYENNPRIMIISGDNFQDGRWRGDGSYYFSKITHIWGWATWRRVWRLYEYDMASFHEFKRLGLIETFHGNANVQNFFLKIFQEMYEKPIDTWDYQLFYTVVKNRGLTVLPNINLITNIGFGSDATHTLDSTSRIANGARGAIKNLVHPLSIMHDTNADDFTLENIYGVRLDPQSGS